MFNKITIFICKLINVYVLKYKFIMDNKEKYNNSFIEALSIDKKKLTKNLEYNSSERPLITNFS